MKHNPDSDAQSIDEVEELRLELRQYLKDIGYSTSEIALIDSEIEENSANVQTAELVHEMLA